MKTAQNTFTRATKPTVTSNRFAELRKNKWLNDNDTSNKDVEENKKDVNKMTRLSFRSKGKDVYVGDFLNEDDKNKLKDKISLIIQELNAQIP